MQKVRVYRNLKHGKRARPLYSIMQNGRVIARRHRVMLTSAVFIVNEAGRQRVIQQKRKNVHAFVEGYLIDEKGAFGQDENGRDLPMTVKYNPYQAGYFQSPTGQRVLGAWGVLLNENGITACYTYNNA